MGIFPIRLQQGSGRGHHESIKTEPTFMNKLVQWMRDGSVPILYKIGVAALGILATIAIAWIFGEKMAEKILTWVCITSAAFISVKAEWDNIDQSNARMIEEANQDAAERRGEAEAAERRREERNRSARAIKELFGGERAYNALPPLDLAGRIGQSGYIDFLQPGELAAPIMKGTDHLGRPFVAMKIEERDTLAAKVLVLFQRYRDEPRWMYKRAEQDVWVESPFTQEETDEIRQLVGGTHPRLALSRAP